MIWVTYRQFRATLLGALGLISLVALVSMISAWILRDVIYASSFGTFFSCFDVRAEQCVAQTSLTATTVGTAVLPVLLGLFVGVAVFSRDIERGTHVLTLSQSVGRVRWYWSRVGVVFVPIVIAMTLLGFALTWTRSLNNTGVWQTIGGTSNSRFDYPIFETSALMPGAYTAAALMIGSTIALVLRNTIGAMVLTLAVVTGLLVLLSVGVRPHYAAPVIQTTSLDGSQGVAYSSDDGTPRWVIDWRYVDAEGAKVSIDYALCDNGQRYWDEQTQRPDETLADWETRSEGLYVEQQQRYSDCLRSQGADRFETLFHEDGRYWRFQITEAVLLLTISALAVALSLTAVRRLRP